MIGLIIALVIIFPLAWFISEYQSTKWPRLVLGCCSIAMAYGVAWLAGSIQAINYNAWYSEASLELVDTTINELAAGHESKVINNLKWLKSQYHANYETGLVDYQRLVGAYTQRFGESKE